MAYKIDGTDVILNNGNAVFTSVTVEGGNINLPDVNPGRNTTGFKISSQTNIDSAGRGVHANVTVNATSPSNNVTVGGTKSFGFTASGMQSSSPVFTISRFSFSNDTDSIIMGGDPGSLYSTHGGAVSSPTHGYTIGGAFVSSLPATNPPITTAPPGSQAGMMTWLPGNLVNFARKFPFQGYTFASQLSTIPSTLLGYMGMVGTQSDTDGYAYGGIPSPTTGFPGGTTQARNVLVKFPFATDVFAVFGTPLAGNGSFYGGGISSSVAGYIAGGGNGVSNDTGSAQYTNGRTHKFPFATGVFSTTLTFTPSPSISPLVAGLHTTGHQSPSHGYYVGGKWSVLSYTNDAPFPGSTQPSSANILNIRKFPFAADSSAALIGFLTPLYSLVDQYAHHSSDSNGYIERGITPGALGGSTSPRFYYTESRKRTKFSFISDGFVNLVGDLATSGGAGGTGHQG
jgi:hypothetical protein